MNFEDLKNPELQDKLRAARTPEELLELAREEDYVFSDEQLEGMNGGWCCECDEDGCPPVGGTISIG